MTLFTVLSVMLVGAGAPGSSPDGKELAVRPRMHMAESIEAGAPVWAVLEVEARAKADPDQIPLATSAILDDKPHFTLRDPANAAEVRPLSHKPRWETGWRAGSFRADWIPLTGGRTFRKKYLLSKLYGRLPPGRYELAARFYLTLTQDNVKYLPGREAPEKRTISAGSVPMVFWALPEQRATFRVTEPTEAAADTVLARAKRLAAQDKLHYITEDDWISLLLQNTEPAWDFLVQHLDRAPEVARETAVMFLLNYGKPDEVVRRASRLLSATSWRVNRIGVDVIEQRGERRDALLLRPYLESGNSQRRRVAYFALSRMLGKPTDPTLGQRRFNDSDVDAGLRWLDEVSSAPGSTGGPTTRPRPGLEWTEFRISTQPATRPASQPAR